MLSLITIWWIIQCYHNIIITIWWITYTMLWSLKIRQPRKAGVPSCPPLSTAVARYVSRRYWRLWRTNFVREGSLDFGKWMFIPLKMVCIGIDPYPHCLTIEQSKKVLLGSEHVLSKRSFPWVIEWFMKYCHQRRDVDIQSSCCRMLQGL